MNEYTSKVLDCMDKNIDMLDDSVTEFIEVVAHEISVGAGVDNIKTGYKLIGDLLVSVFGDLQSVVDYLVNEEHVCKWEGLDDLNKLCAKYQDIMPTPVMMFIALKNNHILLEDGKGNKYDIKDVNLSNIDYIFASQQDKPILFNVGGYKMRDLGPNQRQCYVPVIESTDFKAGGTGYLPGYKVKRIGNDIYTLEGCLMDYKLPLYFVQVQEVIDCKNKAGKPILSSSDYVQTVLPKEIVDKYGYEIKHLN